MSTIASLHKYFATFGRTSYAKGESVGTRVAATQDHSAGVWKASARAVSDLPERLGLKRGSLEYLILTRLPFLAMLAALIGNIVLSAPYTARAKLLIPFGREYTYRPIVGEGINLAPWRQEVAINTEMEILNGITLKTEVVKAVGPERLLGESVQAGAPGQFQIFKSNVKKILYHAGLGSLPKSPIEKGLEVINRGLEVTTVKDSNIVHVAFTHSERELAMRVLGAHLESYIALRSQYFEPPDSPVLTNVLDSQQKELKSAERDLEDYKAKNKITVIDAQLKNAFEQEMNIRKQYTETEVALTQAKGKQHTAGPLEELSSEVMAELKASIGGLESAKSELAKKAKEALAQITALEAHKASINQLEDEIKIRRERLLRIRDKVEEVHFERSLSDARWSNVRIIEPPFSPEQPATLGPMVKIGLAGVVGLLAALGLSLGLVLANGRTPRQAAVEPDPEDTLNSEDTVKPIAPSNQAMATRKRGAAG